MLKITSGRFKKRKINVPRNSQVRPTQAKLRLHVFNYLADFLQNAKILDLYAGTGAFGIEALSRGAKHATFVDKVSKSIRTIEKNINTLGIKDKTTLIKQDAIQFLVRAFKKQDLYDIIFIDPPFDKLLAMPESERTSYILELLDRAQKILNPKSIIILKMFKKIDVPIPESLTTFHTKHFGINKLYYLLQKEYVL